MREQPLQLPLPSSLRDTSFSDAGPCCLVGGGKGASWWEAAEALETAARASIASSRTAVAVRAIMRVNLRKEEEKGVSV